MGPWILLGLALVWGTGLSRAQAQAPKPDDDPSKVSNDQTTRPLQMPAASNEAREAFEDFERFRRRGAWERASKALDAIPDAQLDRFVDGKDGFIIPVRRKRADVLAALPPDGLAAYRLFHDAEARKLLDEAGGATEQATLERLASNYFQTDSGDNAADRLGDLYFEAGRYVRAADCWLAIRRDRPDSELSPALLGVKAALALHKAGRVGAVRALRRDLAERHGGEVIAVGGRSAPVREHLDRLLGPEVAERPASAGPTGKRPGGPLLAGSMVPAWQVRFGASVTAGMTPAEASQWHDNGLSIAVPAVAVAGPSLYANYLGYVFAVDLQTGKLRWRSAPFHNLDVVAMSEMAMALADPTKFAVVASERFVWSLGRDLKEQNYQAVAGLTCRRAENGEVVWRSGDSADLGRLDLVGLPVLTDDALLVAAKSTGGGYYGGGGTDNQPRQYVLALRPHDGKLLWKTEVAVFRQVGYSYYYYNARDLTPQPRIAVHAGAIYVDTHQGVMVKLDARTGAIDWGYGYLTEPMQGESRFFFVRMNQTQENAPVGTPPIAAGEALLIKGAKSDRIAVIDPDAMAVLWERTIAKTAQPLALDDATILIGGPDLEALDRKGRALRWTLPLPPGSNIGQTLVTADALWQFTTRGIFEVDPSSGAVRRILRIDDDGGSGGDLILTDRYLLAISDRTIAAFPRDGVPSDRASAGDGPADTKAKGDE